MKTRYTYAEAVELSATEFHLLRQRAIHKDLFDAAHEKMLRLKYTCDIAAGTMRNVKGQQMSFTAYDWESDYHTAPHHIFFDFFRPVLLNLYGRALRDVPTVT